MANPQSELTARMATEFGLEIIRFRHFDCLVLSDSEVLKLFQPRSKRILGCGPSDRIVYGDFVFMLKCDLRRLKPPSPKYEFVHDKMIGFPTANFPGLIEYSLISDQPLRPELLLGLRKLVDALPDDNAGWIEMFGSQVFASRSHEYVVKLIEKLRVVALD
jgi:hypothetical protein|tara:strand:- start:626 stop:1108 length:483 start_codon:yes stop_codon:yes gene_type:complete